MKMLHTSNFVRCRPRFRHGFSQLPHGLRLSWLKNRYSIGMFIGLMLIISGCNSTQTAQVPSPAGTVNDDEVVRYAKALLAIETSRQAAVTEISRINDGNLPAIICSQPDSLKNLVRSVQAIAVNYCQQAKQAGETNGFNMARFNAITANLPNDAGLIQRIQTELARLQQTNPSSQIVPTAPNTPAAPTNSSEPSPVAPTNSSEPSPVAPTNSSEPVAPTTSPSP
jgi:hypothetical protein